MEYRYPVGRRVADSLISLFPLLVGAFMVVATVRFLVDPPADDSHGIRRVVGSVIFVAIGLLPAAVLGCAGLALIRKALIDRLVVTGDGLVSREGRLIRVRVTTIPWSSVTSFTVKGLGPHSTVVTAVLDSDQQVKLPGTARRQVAGTTTIAEELTTRLRTAV